MESTLYLDLSTDATRKSIFGQLVAATPEQRRGNIGVVVGDDSIPAKAHLHDLADVERAIGTSVASDWTRRRQSRCTASWHRPRRRCTVAPSRRHTFTRSVSG